MSTKSETPTGERAPMPLKIPHDLKDRIQDYAKQMGIPLNSAGILLLHRGLRAIDDEGGTATHRPATSE